MRGNNPPSRVKAERRWKAQDDAQRAEQTDRAIRADADKEFMAAFLACPRPAMTWLDHQRAKPPSDARQRAMARQLEITPRWVWDRMMARAARFQWND